MPTLEEQHPTVQTLRGIFAEMVNKDPQIAAEGEQKLIALVEEDGDIRFHRSHQINSQSKVLATYILQTLTNMFSQPESRLAGVRAVSVLLDVDFCELSTRTTRFSYLLLSAAGDTSATTSAAVAAWGRLISNGSGLIGDITRAARDKVQSLFSEEKGSTAEKSERRFVASLILYQLADRASNVLLGRLDDLRTGLETAITDPLELTRRTAATAMRRFLDLCLRTDLGEGNNHKAILNRLLDFSITGFTNKSLAVQHGAWLTLNATLEACGEMAANTAASAAQQGGQIDNAVGGGSQRLASRGATLPLSSSVSNLLSTSASASPTSSRHVNPNGDMAAGTGAFSPSERIAARFGIDHSRMQRVWNYVLQSFTKAHAPSTSSAFSSSSSGVSAEVRAEMQNAIPLMAKYDKETFMRFGLSDVLNSSLGLTKSLTATVEEKNQMFLMIGKLSTVLTGHIGVYVDRVIRAIEDNLIAVAKKPKKDRCPEAVTCLAMLAKADPTSVRPYMGTLLNPIFAGAPTVEFAKNVASLCQSFPEYRSACLDRMLALVRRQLSAIPIRNFLTANEASNTAKLIDSFRAIGECDCTGFSMLTFLSTEVAPRFWDPHQQVRRMAAELCSRLLLCGCHAPSSPCYTDSEGSVIHVGAAHISLILRLQQQLLAVAVADPEPDIRLSTLAMLDVRFDHTLSVQDCVRSIFPALNDRHQNRAAAVSLLGRLSRHNPSAVFPTLRKILIQCITEIDYLKDANRFTLGGVDERRLEQATVILGEVVAAAPELIQPYRASLLSSTVLRLKAPGTSPIVLTALLSCIGKLVKHTREQDLHIVHGLAPIVVEHILDSTSSAKKQEAIRTLTCIVRATRDVSLYDEYPSLLPTLLSMLHGGFKEPWACRRDTLSLLGAVGAVDPVKVKAIFRQTREGSEANTNFRARPEDLPATVVNAVLSVMKMASSNEEVLSLSAQALREIFVSGSMKMNEATGFLDRIIPEFRRHIAHSPGLREKFLKELSLFVAFFKHHIRAYRDGLFETLRQQINGDVPAVLNQCIALITELRACLREEFKPYLPSLLPLLVGTLHNDTTPERKSAILVLECFTALGRLLDGHLHVVLPEVVEMVNKCPSPEAREMAIVTVLNFAKHLPSLSDHAARCVHCLLRVIAEPLPTTTTKSDPKGSRPIPNSIHTQCLQALTAIAQNLGEGFSKFVPMVRPALASRFREGSLEYEREMQNYANAIADGKTIYPEPPFQSRNEETATAAAFFQQQQQQLQRMSEADRFKTLADHMSAMHTRNNDEEGWKPWLHQFCVQLLRASPSSALRVCANLAQAHEPFARLLFYPAFASCFAEMNEFRTIIGRVISTALDDRNTYVSTEVRQEILNLAEYMERVEEFASKSARGGRGGSSSSKSGGSGGGNSSTDYNTRHPPVAFSALLDVRVLASHSERSNLYAKTIHYLEMQFLELTSSFRESLLFGRTRALKPQQWQELLGICEQCIKLCNYLNMSETANGILSFIQKYYGQITGEVTPANVDLSSILAAAAEGGNQNRVTAIGARSNTTTNATNIANATNTTVASSSNNEVAAKGAAASTSPSRAAINTVNTNTSVNPNLSSSPNGGGGGGLELSAEMYEKLQWWSQSLGAYEARLRQDPQNVSHLLGVMKSLEGLGDYPRLLEMYRLAVRRGNRKLLSAASPIGARAAWLMQMWGDLRLATDHMPQEGYNVTIAQFYRAVLAAHNDNLTECQHHIDECRKHLDPSLTALVSESYDRAYPRLVDLQQLSELEEICLAKRDKSLLPALKELWQRRLSAMAHSPTEWQGTLANHTLVLAPQEELSMWIQFVALCRSNDRNVVARAALTRLLGGRTVEEVLASLPTASPVSATPGGGGVGGNSSATLLSSSSAFLQSGGLSSPATTTGGGGNASPFGVGSPTSDPFASVSSVGVGGRPLNQYLMNNLQGSSSALIPTTAGGFGNPAAAATGRVAAGVVNVSANINIGASATINNAVAANVAAAAAATTRPIVALAALSHTYESGKQDEAVSLLSRYIVAMSNPSTFSSASLSAQQYVSAHPSELALCRAKLSEWLCQRNSDYVKDPALRETIISNLEEATKLDPTNGGVWHQWARVQHDVAESLSHGPNSNDNHSSSSPTASLSDGSPTAASSPSPLLSSVSLSRGGTTLIAERDGHVVAAIEGYLSSIRIGRQMQDVLGFLSLWFTHGSRPAVNEAVVNGLPQIYVNVWLSVIPQIIARIQADSPKIQESVHNLLVMVAKAHPQALLYTLNAGIDPFTTSGEDSEEAKRRRPREKILSKIEEIHGHEGVRMVSEARMDTQELIRCAVLWAERWLDELQTIHKQWCDDDDLEKVVSTLSPLVKLMDDPRTSAEENFVLEHGVQIREAFRLMSEAAALSKSPETSAAKAKEAWGVFDDLYNRFDAQIKSISTLVMDFVSPRLVSHGRNQSVAVPGTYTGKPNFPRVASFVPEMRVINSKQHPRRIGVMGSDGQKHVFLLKGHEDLRQDERVMQLLGLVNTVLETHNGTRRRECTVQLYSVTPLGDRAGLVGWVNGCDTLHALIKDYRGNNNKAICAEQNVIKSMHDASEDKPTVIQKQELHERAHEVTQGMDIARSLWAHAPSSEVWLDRRTTYVRTLASMSMVGHVLGLGDRHPSNLMLHSVSGRIVHIDFGDCFEVAMHRSMYPEKVPFRLTRMLVNAMEVSGIDGLFRHGSESVMDVLRQERTSMLALLEAFIHDPLVTWQLNEEEDADEADEVSAREEERVTKRGTATNAANKDPVSAANLTSAEALAAEAAVMGVEVSLADAESLVKLQQEVAATSFKASAKSVGFKHLGLEPDMVDLTGASIRSIRAMTMTKSVRHGTVGASMAATGGAKRSRKNAANANNADTFTVAAVANSNKQATKVIGRIREKLNGLEFVDTNDFMYRQRQQQQRQRAGGAPLQHQPLTGDAMSAGGSMRFRQSSTESGGGITEGAKGGSGTPVMPPSPTPEAIPPSSGAAGSSKINGAAGVVGAGATSGPIVVTPLSVSEQVDKLIQQAIASENLCQHYQGWCAFW